MDDNSQEKEFEATPERLLEARRKGEIAKSSDLNTAAAYLGFLVTLQFMGGDIIKDLGTILFEIVELTRDPRATRSTVQFTNILGNKIKDVMSVTIPIFLIPAIFVMASVTLQKSITFAPNKIQPKISKISIISGFKNKFGRAGLFEFFKSSLKLILFLIILTIFIILNFDEIALTSRISPGAAFISLSRLMGNLLLIVFSLAATIGCVDFIFQRAEHLRKNRMSRKEIMDEMKMAEGDPHLKQKRRQKAIALSTNKMLSDTKDSSVVIVNPTHFAVALKWDRESDPAPVVVAKGMDEMAGQIRRIALEKNIPIHSDPPTARSLYAVVDIGETVSPIHYNAVAEAIRFADSMRAEQKERPYG